MTDKTADAGALPTPFEQWFAELIKENPFCVADEYDNMLRKEAFEAGLIAATEQIASLQRSVKTSDALLNEYIEKTKYAEEQIAALKAEHPTEEMMKAAYVYLKECREQGRTELYSEMYKAMRNAARGGENK
jgi:hypothetical protein